MMNDVRRNEVKDVFSPKGKGSIIIYEDGRIKCAIILQKLVLDMQKMKEDKYKLNIGGKNQNLTYVIQKGNCEHNENIIEEV